ncbi:MAG: SPOR domain-containing protein [Rickettsiaceae bacterium]|nr:SPOR domain-containing protein [Rickettsiaceae bacterium]
MKYKKLLFITVFFVIASISSSLIYWYYFTGQENVIVITDEDDEYKKRPDDPGGIVLANSSSLIYEKLRKNIVKEKNVRILPEPEPPLKIDFKEKNIDSIDVILANLDFYEQIDFDQYNEEDNGNVAVIMPNLLKKAEQQSPVDDSLETDLNIIRVNKDDSKLLALAKQELKEASGYKLQLSLAKTEMEAIKCWKGLQKKYGEILGNAYLVTRRIKGKNNRIFFLVMAGTYPSLPEAKRVCKKLIARKQNCIIVN